MFNYIDGKSIDQLEWMLATVFTGRGPFVLLWVAKWGPVRPACNLYHEDSNASVPGGH